MRDVASEVIEKVITRLRSLIIMYEMLNPTFHMAISGLVRSAPRRRPGRKTQWCEGRFKLDTIVNTSHPQSQQRNSTTGTKTIAVSSIQLFLEVIVSIDSKNVSSNHVSKDGQDCYMRAWFMRICASCTRNTTFESCLRYPRYQNRFIA